LHRVWPYPSLSFFIINTNRYALSQDGLWRQHSWNYNSDEDLVIETTQERIAYYGTVLGLYHTLYHIMTNSDFDKYYTKYIDMFSKKFPDMKFALVNAFSTELPVLAQKIEELSKWGNVN
jgi:hypothetical protein